jgi:hypothetical protein
MLDSVAWGCRHDLLLVFLLLCVAVDGQVGDRLAQLDIGALDSSPNQAEAMDLLRDIAADIKQLTKLAAANLQCNREMLAAKKERPVTAATVRILAAGCSPILITAVPSTIAVHTVVLSEQAPDSAPAPSMASASCTPRLVPYERLLPVHPVCSRPTRHRPSPQTCPWT